MREDPSQRYPSSALSGKPVVVMARIRTERRRQRQHHGHQNRRPQTARIYDEEDWVGENHADRTPPGPCSHSFLELALLFWRTPLLYAGEKTIQIPTFGYWSSERRN